MAFLITASLYNAYRYYAESSFEGTPESDLKARQDFLNVLNKVPVPRTEAIQKGIDFENEIYAMTNKGIESQDTASLPPGARSSTNALSVGSMISNS